MIETLAKRDREAQAAYRVAEAEARKVRAEARAELLDAIRASGLSLRQAAPLVGVSAQRLHVLLKPPAKRRAR